MVTGIIAEFNPLHSGHKFLIDKAIDLGEVVCVICGNFVQRGDTAIAEKSVRAKSALLSGADLVIELPVLWSMSTAQNFALGGVSALLNAGCDCIMFGSECGDIEKLTATAEVLSSPQFSDILSAHLKTGITFAKARELAAEELGAEKGILSGANNNLAIEYILAAKTLGSNITFKTVKRQGAMHDSRQEDEFVSASLLREKILQRDMAFTEKYIPIETKETLFSSSFSDISRLERAILAVIRTRSIEELKNLPDISEGVENKLFSAINIAKSLDELYNLIKVKRYTLARIRRLVLSAFLGVEKSFFLKPLPYIRVLGFSKSGEKLLRTRLQKSSVPVITKIGDLEKLTTQSKMVFEIENRATDLYALSLEEPFPRGMEYTSKIIKTE